MLLFDNHATITIDGVTVLPDHASKNHFWCLPGPVQLARRGPDDQAQFTFIAWRPDPADVQSKGGGFLMFETQLALSDETRDRILAAVRPLSDGEPRLGIVQFDSGTVKCIALDLEGSGGTAAEPVPAGAMRVTEQILGARTPSLAGVNSAAFSLELSQEGAVIVEQAFEKGTAPVGVIYDLAYTGLRPALSVQLTADLNRVYNHFSAAIEGKYFWLKGGIEAALDFLKQEGVIQVKVIDFTAEDDRAEKEQWALDLFTKQLMKEWFEPTFAPAEAAKISDEASPAKSAIDKVGDAVGKIGDAAGKVGDAAGKIGDAVGGGKGDATGKPADGTKAVDPAPAPTPGPTPNPTPNPTPSPVPARPAAAFQVTKRVPDPLPDGIAIAHQPAATGTAETITIMGSPATVRVDGKPATLVEGKLTVDVAEGGSHALVVEIPAVEQSTESFALLFDFDKPAAAGFSVLPPSTTFTSYLANSPNPRDEQFSKSAAPGGTGAARGADALRAWIRDRVTDKEVTIHAQASFEGKRDTNTVDHNQRLSERRLKVAQGIIGTLARVSTASKATGQELNADVPPPADQADRVATITAKVGAARPAVRIEATLSRAKAAPPDDKKDEKKDEKKDGDKPDDKKDEKKDEKKDGGDPIGLAFKLKFVHQEERKTLTISYDRTEAVQRTYAAQGFFGLLLDDLADKSKHFVDVKLDDVFFRRFEVVADAPFDFAAVGLASAQVAIDYGEPSDPANHHHADFVFSAADHGPRTTSFFLNDRADTTYRHGVQFHFDPDSGWRGRTTSVSIPSAVTADRTLLINPHELIGFLDVLVVPNRIDADLVDAIDVELSHQFADGAVISDVLRVRPGGEALHWKIRTESPDDRSYSFSLVHFLKDGTTRREGPFVGTAAALPVDDPFRRPLEIELFPAFEPTAVRSAIVDVQYDDNDNDYHRAERAVISGIDPKHLRISLVDPELRQFRYRLTILGTDNSVRQDAFIETSDTLVLVR